jgi:NAD(P)-dependent dehydrogenase (short-subunit alcohol dehydrogenase family)
MRHSMLFKWGEAHQPTTSDATTDAARIDPCATHAGSDLRGHCASPVAGDRTERHPGPEVQPSDVASATAFLLSDDARYITGHTIPVDAGALCRVANQRELTSVE